MSRPVLVTGAGGFVGAHLLRAAGARADAVAPVVLVRDRPAWERSRADLSLAPTAVVQGELGDEARWRGARELDGLGAIVHLAARVRHSRAHADSDMHRTNVEGTLAMVRLAAHKRCRLVYLSTSGVVGCFRSAHERADEDADYCDEAVARWPYYRSKLEAERLARRLAGRLGVELVVVRPPVLLGPDDHGGRSTANVRRVLGGRVPVLMRGGMHFTDVRDVASALLELVVHPSPRPVYHLTGTEEPLPDFFRRVARVGGVALRAPVVPTGPVWALSWLNQRLGRRALGLFPDPVLVEMSSRHWGLRSRYAERDLGYAPRPPDETLRDTIAWLRAREAP